ncbi:CYFA0S13e02322g1_1 [Cyberlindnera fabianii]|uniref:CYFA0S13e02322g1_1 n=1 Tax=Cyberlindnera fabianii TaxID=36022 RepID=A0A061B2C3_CYBFA|nr:CYFA0S13e02322g1_1 [Cyberlindnera fabianii]
MLTKRLRKAVIIATAVGTITTFVLLFHTNPEYVQNVHDKIKSQEMGLGDLRDNFEYYQNLMANYTSSFYEDLTRNIDALKNTDGILQNPSDMRALLSPAFEEGSIKPKDALRENVGFFSNIVKKKIDEPKNLKLVKIGELESTEGYVRENATFVSLVRNSELKGIVGTIKQIEDTFNSKYHYPYVFLNDQPFTKKFKQAIQEATESKCFFEQVPAEDWDRPSNIDPKREEEGVKYLEEKGVGYARKLSYHNMCRYYSGKFYNHPRLQQYRYYWRVEPKTNYFCDIDYDVFKFMNDNNKIYGFVLNLYDSPDSVQSLWPVTMEFLSKNPQYLHKNAATTWLRENLQNPDNFKGAHGYSTCHFWSNFEIGDMDFFRGEAYSTWMDFLNEAGGFYYERWGDAPVHSIGLGLFADKSQIHWFRDIGYEHFPYYNCPVSSKCHGRCKAGKFSQWTSLDDQNCQATWAKYEMTEKELEYY